MTIKTMIKNLLTVGLISLLVPAAGYAVIPLPYRIGGTVTVDGVQLTQATDTGYTFVVTPYIGAGGIVPQDTDGLNGTNWYVIDIPMYDASDQPGGAQSGQLAFISVYKDGSPIDIISPANGQFPVGDAGTNGNINVVAFINTPPAADAGGNQTVLESVPVVTLDGSGSFDAESGLTYQWTQTGGMGVTLSGSNTVSPAFTPPNVGPAGAVLTFRLRVTDTGGMTDTDTCSVTVNWVDAPPTASAGPDQAVGEGGVQVTLNGSGSFDDAGIIAYQWFQTSGTNVALSNANAVSPTFAAPATAPDVMTFELTVTDTGFQTDTDTCTVTVSDAPLLPPIADAGSDQAVDENVEVTLDGSGSSDPDGTIETYQWSQTDGPAVILSDPAAVVPAFTAPDQGPVSLIFALTVTDNDGQTDTDTCTVVVGGAFKVATSLLFPYFASSANYWRGVAIVNPGVSNGIINLTLHDTTGKTATAAAIVNAGTTFVNLIDNISWSGNADVSGRCYLTATMNFFEGRGFAMFGDNTGNSMGYVVDGLDETTAPTNLLFPYFASSATYWRGIVIVNPSDSYGIVTLTLHDATGRTATATIPLNAGNLFVQMVENINWTGTADVDGRCHITATMNFAGGQGFAMFGDNSGNSLGYVVK